MTQLVQACSAVRAGAGDSLLLATHVILRRGPAGLQIDDQTAAGIAQWCKYFGAVTYYGISEVVDDRSASSAAWVDVETCPGLERCRFVALPHAYRIRSMVANYKEVRSRLRQEIAVHTHLCFTIGGLIGDWPAVAALEAVRQRRRYVAWIDRVEPFIIRDKLSAGASFAKRAAASILLPVMEMHTRRLLRRSSVALLQGRDTFDHYAASATDARCTYDTHTQVSDEIAADDLAAKKRRVVNGAPLKILYVGRAAAMKGPHDWLAALEVLAKKAIPFEATWIGDGPELDPMRERIGASDLGNRVRLHGFEEDRAVLLLAMRQHDLFLYCHKTPESPRSLIEALVSGCPLVGYASAYSAGLVEQHGGGVFSSIGDVQALADQLEKLHVDRMQMASLIEAAATSGRLYNEDSVYAYRAILMRGDQHET